MGAAGAICVCISGTGDIASGLMAVCLETDRQRALSETTLKAELVVKESGSNGTCSSCRYARVRVMAHALVSCGHPAMVDSDGDLARILSLEGIRWSDSHRDGAGPNL